LPPLVPPPRRRRRDITYIANLELVEATRVEAEAIMATSELVAPGVSRRDP
jgi:hypothetical protein